MADLHLIQSGRVEAAGIPGAVLPTVNPTQVDYVGLKAGAQYQGTVAQTLDRLSFQLFGIAKTAANEAGMQYVADNPPTDEQLQAAKSGDVAPLKLGGTFSVYDQAVRKARSFELSGIFEREASIQMTRMLTEVELGKTTTEQVQVKLKSMMDGFSKTLSQVEPEASLKFRATSAMMGNTVLAKAAEFEMKREKAKRLVEFDVSFDNRIILLEAAVSQGFWIDPRTQEKRSIEDLADVYRSINSTGALLLGDAGVQKQYSDKFEVALKNAKINSVSKFLIGDDAAMADTEATLKNIQSGNVGKMSDVVKGMLLSDYASIEKVSANFMVAVNARNSAVNTKLAADKRVNEQTGIDLLEKIFVLPEGNAKRNQLIKELTTLPAGAVPIGTLKDLLEPNKDGNPAVEFNLLNGIYYGTITNPQEIWSLVGKGIDGKQAISALKFFYREDRQDQHELSSGISKLAGISVIPGSLVIIDRTGVEFKRRTELEAQAFQIQAAAALKGKTLTSRQILAELEDSISKSRNTEGAKAARNALENTWEKKAGGKITRETLPALEGSKKFNANEIKAIKRLLDQAEGIQ